MIHAPRRLYSLLPSSKGNSLFQGKSILAKKPKIDVHPDYPVRTRFAPSPTGFLHMGSLRTALYNYLLARNTGGQFLLRLEDTDQKRLVEGAEENIYESLKWCGIQYDEGPGVNDIKNGQYRQSDRTNIYRKYIDKLLDEGHAYRCFCTKDRLDGLRASAQQLQPPTTTSYDRYCYHLSNTEIKEKIDAKIPFTVRMKAPDVYPAFKDLLHGELNVQQQFNHNDRRYDDPILMKSDNLPTYHFANVIDDYLMKITHVIRGEEWLPSTPKHIALYSAFGWSPPHFIHIPLLTSLTDKKLSKRKGDSSVLKFKEKGVLPEALVNFSVLFGWSPPRELSSKNHECFTMLEFEKLFNLNYLTKGNAKVDEKKLWFFNKHYLQEYLRNPENLERATNKILPVVQERFSKSIASYETVSTILQSCGSALASLMEFNNTFSYFFEEPNFNNTEYIEKFLKNRNIDDVLSILNGVKGNIEGKDIEEMVTTLVSELNVSKKDVFRSLRFALAASHPGAKIPVLIDIIGSQETNNRIQRAIQYLKATLP